MSRQRNARQPHFINESLEPAAPRAAAQDSVIVRPDENGILVVPNGTRERRGGDLNAVEKQIHVAPVPLAGDVMPRVQRGFRRPDQSCPVTRICKLEPQVSLRRNLELIGIVESAAKLFP